MSMRSLLAVAAALAATLAAEAAESFGYATWNVGHFSLGLKNLPSIAPADASAKAGEYRMFLSEAGVSVLGTCEHSTAFTSDKSLKSADTAFADFPGCAYVPLSSGHANAVMWKGDVTLVDSGYHNFPVRNAKCYCQWARLRVRGREVCFVEAHCDWNTMDAGHEFDRVEQMRFLARTFGKEPRVVISGDFNSCVRNRVTGKWTDAFKEFEIFRQAGFDAAHWGELKTWPASGPYLGIDNIFTKGLAISDVRAQRDKTLSDHSLLRCTLTFKE